MVPFTSTGKLARSFFVDQVDDELLEQCGIADVVARVLEDDAEHARAHAEAVENLLILRLECGSVELQQRLPAKLRRHDGLARL